MNREKEYNEKVNGMKFSFLNITIQFEENRDESVSPSSSDSSGDLPPLVFCSDSSDDDSTDTEVISSTSSYSMPELRFGAEAYDSDSSDEDTVESEDTSQFPPLVSHSGSYNSNSSDEDTAKSEDTIQMSPLVSRSGLYDYEFSDEDTVESEDKIGSKKIIGNLSRKKKNEGEKVLAVVSEGGEEAVPDEVSSKNVELKR